MVEDMTYNGKQEVDNSVYNFQNNTYWFINFSIKARLYSLVSTLIITGLLLLFLLLYYIHTPDPPYPEGGGGVGDGIELNLGFSDAGAGNNPQEFAAEPEKTVPQPETQPQQENEKILTQDVEDAPSINEKAVDAKKNVKKENTVAPKKKEPEKTKPVVNTNALFPSKTKQASADGNKSTAGDQGDPNGSLAAKAFGGKSGSGGSGGGSGGGTGTGKGSGIGSGVSFKLDGREQVGAWPSPEYKQQVEGVVVVEVTVDKEGRVTQAEPGKKGTTTNDEGLWDAAKKAALQARFTRKPDAPPFQKGTITYRFRLQ